MKIILNRECNGCFDCPFSSNDNEYGITCNLLREYTANKYYLDKFNPRCPLTEEVLKQLNEIKI